MDWRIDIEDGGLSGTIHYQESAGRLTFYWEFGGGDVVATIDVGSAADWGIRNPWAGDRRTAILQRVAA